MGGIIDISGNTYNMLTVIKFDHMAGRRRSYWLCRCECRKEKVLRKDSFAYPYSKVKSCGCYHDNVSRERMNKNRDDKTGRVKREEK